MERERICVFQSGMVAAICACGGGHKTRNGARVSASSLSGDCGRNRQRRRPFAFVRHARTVFPRHRDGALLFDCGNHAACMPVSRCAKSKKRLRTSERLVAVGRQRRVEEFCACASGERDGDCGVHKWSYGDTYLRTRSDGGDWTRAAGVFVGVEGLRGGYFAETNERARTATPRPTSRNKAVAGSGAGVGGGSPLIVRSYELVSPKRPSVASNE